MGGTATHSKAVALGCDYGAANRRLSRSRSGQPILWLWISSVDLSWRAAEICPHRIPGPNDPRRSCLKACDGAHGGPAKAVRPYLERRDDRLVARRTRAARQVIIVGDRPLFLRPKERAPPPGGDQRASSDFRLGSICSVSARGWVRRK